MNSWELVAISMQRDEDITYLDEMLHAGWEPFAATQDKHITIYHLKRILT